MGLLAKDKSNSIQNHRDDGKPNVIWSSTSQEISLLDLSLIGYQLKGIIISVAVITTLASFGLTFLIKKVYRAEAYVLPPKVLDIRGLTIPGLEEDGEKTVTITPGVVFEEFQKTIKTKELQTQFFLAEVKNISLQSKASSIDPLLQKEIESFLAKIHVSEGSIAIEDADPERAATWANALIQFADRSTVVRFTGEIRRSISDRILVKSGTIARARRAAHSDRLDLIMRYEEAAKLAQNLGIKNNRVDYQASSLMSIIHREKDMERHNPVEISSALYLEGTTDLIAKIEMLKNRANDDPYIYGLGAEKEQVAWLESLVIADKDIAAVSVDQPAYAPRFPASPNRQLYVLFGLGIGILAGIFVASVVYLWRMVNEAV